MNPSFSELGLSQERVQQLEKLGFTEPTHIQAQAIPHLLNGRDVVGQSQTGTGKTAAFSLPILDRLDVKKSCRTSFSFSTNPRTCHPSPRCRCYLRW